MNNPVISVIIPVYNVEPYLKKCLDSVLAQTFKDFEVICIDDGSTDNSLTILQEYANKDSRFKVISQQNQGQGVARNKGVDLANGKYIQFVDPDDWIEVDAFEKLYNFANAKNSNVVRFNYTLYNNYSGKIQKKDFAKHIIKIYDYDLNEKAYFNWQDLKKGCLTKFGFAVWYYFYNADFIKRNNIKFAPNKLSEDHLFADGAILLADKIDFLDEYLYYYRQRSGSAVYVQSDDNFCIFENIERLKQFIIDHSLYEELKEEFQNYSQLVISWQYNSIPQKSIKRYESLCRQYFNSEKEFKKFITHKKSNRSFIENIFSVKNKNVNAVKSKAITILGYTFFIKPKNINTAQTGMDVERERERERERVCV